MDTIWAIFSGEYSDWDVYGFCETEEDAKLVCAMWNADPHDNEDYYYIELKKLSMEKRPGVYEYRHIFKVMEDCGERQYKIKPYHGYDPVVVYHETHHAPEIKPGDSKYDLAKIYVWTKDENDERAEKIAQDAWYKYLAEKEGI